MQGGQIRMVQALRAAACLLVVVFHTVPGSLHKWPNGAAGVDLFFVISGYVMVVSQRGRGDGVAAGQRFLAQRARRIVPLYWLLTAAKLGLATIWPQTAPHTHTTPWNVVASLMFIPAHDGVGLVQPPLSVGWTLNFEMAFYALFAACLALRWNPLRMTPLLLGLALAGFWRDPSWPAPLILADGLPLEFAAGMLLGSLDVGVPRRVAPWMLAGCLLLLVSVPSCGPWRFLMRGVPAAAVLAAALALETTAGARLPRWFIAVGDASYAVYLVHPFLVPSRFGNGAVAGSAAVLASVIAGVLVHRYVDTPMQRFLGRRRRAAKTYVPGAGVLSG